MTQTELVTTTPQVGFAFHRIESALTLLVQNLSDLSSLAAKTERIDTLFSGAPISHMFFSHFALTLNFVWVALQRFGPVPLCCCCPTSLCFHRHCPGDCSICKLSIHASIAA